jgi:purine-binding chemotaxis protein CheW
VSAEAARQEILAARARAIAESREQVAEDGELALAFRVGGEKYAVPLRDLEAVLPSRGVHPLAGAPRWLLGAMVARARLVPVLDLRQILRLEGGGMSDLVNVVVVAADGEAFGIAVESLEGYVRVPRSCPRPATHGPFRHLTADRVAVLDPDALARAAGALG